MDAGLIPVKDLASAKSRLREHLGEARRAALVRALFEDVLGACREVSEVAWWVVTSDAEARAVAAEAGVDSIDDPGGGLNAALALAAKEVQRMGATSTTIVPADVPLVRPSDLRDLLDTGATSDVVVVPAGKDGGTNALFLSPPDLLEPHFGRNSLQAHIASAEKRRLRCAVLSLPRLSLDLDTPDDIEDLLAGARGVTSKSIALLQSWPSG